MNELQVVVDQKPGVIGFNFEEIRDELQARMELYKNATFTDEYRVYAKNEVAALRKMKKAIDDKRKEVKNQYMIPYNDFEGKAKELMQIIDQPIGLISQQITEMEERRKAEKKAKIGALYDSLVGDLGDYLTLKKIYNAKWENASTSMAAVRKEMEEVFSSVRKEVAMLEAMTSDAVPEALRRYKEDLDLAGAINYVNQYEAQNAEIMKREAEKKRLEEEQKRRAEEERIRKEERERIKEEERIAEWVKQQMAAGKLKFKKFTCGLDTSYSSKSPDTIAMLFQGITEDRKLITLAEKVYSWNEEKDIPEDRNDHTINAQQYGWIPYRNMIGFKEEEKR